MIANGFRFPPTWIWTTRGGSEWRRQDMGRAAYIISFDERKRQIRCQKMGHC
jgi:hypothetical protein